MDDSKALIENSDPIQPQNFVVIRDDYFQIESPVFPPIHHEDFPVPPPPDESASPPPSPRPATAERVAVSELQGRVAAEASRIWRLSREVVKSKVVSRILRFGSSFVVPVVAMAALLLFWMKLKMQLPWRPRTVSVNRDKEQRLLLLLKEKDQVLSTAPS